MKEEENLVDVNTHLLPEEEGKANTNNKVKDRRRSKKLEDIKESKNSKFEMVLYTIIVTILLLVLIFIFYYLHYGEYKVDVLIEDKDMIKPIIDMRKYKLIKLQNNLDVLLISDKNTTKCSASMSVGVGSFLDGDIPGLTHFTEHMIFLGSKSYPKPSLFEDHLRNYLGSTNAFTEEEKTTFYFDIEWQGFTKALDMFSRMFAEPLFDTNYMNREIEAVNSENEKNLNKDPWRENQIIKSLANPKHPYSKFTTGNRKTLTSVDIQTLHSKVSALYDTFYMPDNMNLVVLSNQNLEQLTQTVAYYFSDIRSEKIEENLRKDKETVTQPAFDVAESIQIPFGPKESEQIIWYQKIVGGRHLDIIFNLDEIISKYQTKPLDYISYLIKYSGQGSLIEYLKKNKLASKLEVGVVTSFKQFSQYAISVYLTEEGLNNVKEVIQLVFNYINLIKHKPLKPYLYEELKNVTSTQFKFLEKPDRYGDYSAALAGSMFNLKEVEYNNVLYTDYIYSNYNETMINYYLQSIKANNSLIVIGTTKYPETGLQGLLDNSAKNKTELWYGTVYKNNKIPKDFLEMLDNSAISGETFRLREQNEFLTSETNIVSCFGVGIITSYKNVTLHELCDMEKADLTPDFAINSKNLLAWYKLDRTFLTPRVNANFLLVSPYLKSGINEFTYLNIYFNFIQTTVNIKLAEAMDAGNQITLEFNEKYIMIVIFSGIVVCISSFTDLIEKITDRTTQIIFNSEVDESNYNQMWEVTRNNLETSLSDQPFEKGIAYFNKIMKHNVTIYQDMIKVIDELKFEEFSKIYKDVQKSFYVVSQFYGNINEQHLLKIESFVQPYLNQDVNLAAQKFNTKEDSVLDYLHHHLELKGSFVFRTINDLPTEVNNAILNFYQMGKRDLRNSLILNLIQMSWENLFFYNLRTVKQLGYIVSASKFVKDNYMYYMFLIQGSKITPDKMNLEIDSVIQLARNKLEDLDDDLLNDFKETLVGEMKKRNNNLKVRSDIVWKEIYEYSLDFNRNFKLIEEIKSITREDLIESFENTFYKDVRKLSVQIYSQTHFEEGFINSGMMTENYNLNPAIKTLITDDFNTFTKLNQK